MFCFKYLSCALLSEVCLCVVLLLFEEIQTSGFKCYNSKRNPLNEHYVKETNFMLYVNKKSFNESHDTKTNI